MSTVLGSLHSVILDGCRLEQAECARSADVPSCAYNGTSGTLPWGSVLSLSTMPAASPYFLLHQLLHDLLPLARLHHFVLLLLFQQGPAL